MMVDVAFVELVWFADKGMALFRSALRILLGLCYPITWT